MNGVNLIPIRLREKRARGQRNRRWAVSCSGYACTVILACLGLHFTHGNASKATAAELEATKKSIDDVKSSVNELKPRITAAQKRLDTIRMVSQQPDWSVLLAMLSEELGGEAVLRSCRLEPSAPPPPAVSAAPAKPTTPGAAAAAAKKEVAPPENSQVRLEISGIGESQLSISQFVLRMQNTGLFSDVKLLKTSREAFEDGQAVAFQLQATLADQARQTKK